MAVGVVYSFVVGQVREWFARADA
eukprot:COSAG01_NODE_19776_length_990_cov_0.903479_3_plen_23_part_01